MDFLRYLFLVSIFALVWMLIARFGPTYGPIVYERLQQFEAFQVED